MLAMMPTLFLLLFCLFADATANSNFGSKPHIVMVLVDDWGWANVGYHVNASEDPDMARATPNIDHLCENGIELDQHYTHSVCGPTRASLLSGRMPSNVNIDNGYVTEYNPEHPAAGGPGILPNMTAISEKLQNAGYDTHVVGKWDAGMATSDQIPQARHFNSSLVFFNHMNDMYTMQQGQCAGYGLVTDLWEDDTPARDLVNTTYEEEIFRDRVLEIIENHDPEKPLFLYYPSRVVHTPLQVPQEYLDKFPGIFPLDRRHYYAMVNYLDDVIGDIVEALKNKDMWKDTLFVMSSDNGGPLYQTAGANNYPLKGGKTSNWQGGIRVNAFAAGGVLPSEMSGQTLDEYIHVCDWYATFCHLAGVSKFDAKAAAAGLRPVDSLNMWPLLSGMNTTSPRTEMYFAPQFYFNTILPTSTGYGLIQGDMKILLELNPYAAYTGPIFPNVTDLEPNFPSDNCEPKGCLYNIRNDPLEEHDLSDDPDMQETLTRMRAKARLYHETTFMPDRGAFPNPEACVYATDPNEYDGFWGPFVFG